AKKNSERDLLLQVSFFSDYYKGNAGYGTGKRSQEDGKQRQPPTEQSTYSKHHFDIAQTHRIYTAKAFPDFPYQPK
ncbi:hypothetical protein OFC23_32440, partial [Escherichia coli]|nr:hypothetical protein [Escherichia coli]